MQSAEVAHLLPVSAVYMLLITIIVVCYYIFDTLFSSAFILFVFNLLVLHNFKITSA